MKDSTVLLIAIALGVVLVAPSILSTGGQAFDKLMDWVNEGFGDGFGVSEGTSKIGLLMGYADGTEYEYKPQDQPFSIVDPEPNKVVSWIQPTVYVTLHKSGYVTSWILTGYQKTELRESTGSAPAIQVWEHDFTKTGSTWSGGDSKAVASQTFQADDIEAYLNSAGYSGGEFKLRFYGKLKTISVTFDDGTTDSIDSGHIKPYTTFWTFLWLSSGIESLDLTISYGTG